MRMIFNKPEPSLVELINFITSMQKQYEAVLKQILVKVEHVDFFPTHIDTP